MTQPLTFRITLGVFTLLSLFSSNAKAQGAALQHQDSINTKLTPEKIMDLVNRNLKRNYSKDYEGFSVENIVGKETTMDKISIDFKKISFLEAKERKNWTSEFDSILEKAQGGTSKTIHHYQYDLVVGKNDSLKMAMKSARLKQNFDGDRAPLSPIVAKICEEIKSTHTFKVKSGLFKIGDSVDLKKYFGTNSSDSVQPKKERKNLKKLWQQVNFRGDDSFQFIKYYTAYNYSFEGQARVNGEKVFILKFKPDSGWADYEGKLYISAKSFAVLRMVYKLAEGKTGKGINMKFLMGIKGVEKKNSGKFIYQKTADGHYVPKLINFTTQEYRYLNRRFKLKENTDSKDRIKIKMKVKAEGRTTTTSKYLFREMAPIGRVGFQQFTEESAFLKCEKF